MSLIAYTQEYLFNFFKFLAQDDDIEVLTYRDLDFGGDFSFENNYLKERLIWNETLKRAGARNKNKIYVFLQHDVDDLVESTHNVLKFQSKLKIRSNVMIFNRQSKYDGGANRFIVGNEDYQLDFNLLKSIESNGWVIGYHSNAYEIGEFDEFNSNVAFQEDIESLRSKFQIDFFCPHGGQRDLNGKSNAHFGLPQKYRNSLIWTLNRHSIRFDGYYSDGNLEERMNYANNVYLGLDSDLDVSNAFKRQSLDLLAFVKTWKPGKRYRLLLHPQYYGLNPNFPDAWLAIPWFEQIQKTSFEFSLSKRL